MNFKTGTKTALSALLALTGLSFGADYSAWTGHRDIVINTAGNGGGTASNLVNFPLLVRLDSAEAAIITDGGVNGASLRFSKADNATPLPYEIEYWGSTKAAIWVKVDTVYGNSSTQKIRMHWNNGAALSESNGPAVFDTATGFVGAWHLGNGTGVVTRPGSVAGAPNAILRNGLPAVPGIIGMADTVGVITGVMPANGGNPAYGRYIDLGKDSAFNNNNYAGFSDFSTGFAYSSWINAATTAAFTRLFVMGADSNATNEIGSTSRVLFMGNQNNSLTAPNFSIRWNGLTNYNSPAGALAYNAWTQIFVTKVGGASTPINVYKNGELLSSSAAGPDAINTMRNYVWLGRSSASTDSYYGGKFDNMTLSKKDRSADWIRLSFRNQQATNSVVNIGKFEFGLTVPGTPTAVTAVAGSASATVSWTAPASDGGSAITSYKAMVTQDTSKTCSTPSLSCVITGLTNGSAYTFIVRANNAIGAGPASLASADTARPAAYASWATHRAIKLNTSASGANVAATVTNFPVLIRLGSATEAAILSGANNGASIRFSKADNATALPYQIESWSGTAATIWVKVDSVKGNNASQTIMMHYGNAGAADSSNGGRVFDTAQYVAVWHLTDTTDATGNGNGARASSVAPAALAASIIGGGKTFNGSTNWYQIGTDSTALNLNTETGPYTLSAWVNPASCDARIAAIAKYTNGATPPGRQFALHTSQAFSDWRFTNGTTAIAGEFTADAPSSCQISTWSHIVGTYKSGTPTTDSSANAKIYVNGVLAGQGTTVTTSGAGRQGNAYIGRIHGAERYMNGSLDEITVAKVARDSNWIRLAYESQKTLNSLTDIGSMITVPGAPTGPTATGSTSTAGLVTVSWVAPTSNGGATITGYTVTGTPGGTCSTTGALTCTITGLTVATSYTFTVKATNGVGQSAASSATTPLVVPTGILGGNYLVHADGFARAYTFRLPEGAQTMTDNLTMIITDAFGRTVWKRTITPAEAKKDREISWNGKSSKGIQVSAGMYIVRVKLEVDGRSQELRQQATTLKPGK